MTAPGKRIVEMGVAMKPTGKLQQALEGAAAKIAALPAQQFDKPKIGSGIVELRIAIAPPQLGYPSGYYCWGIVESYPGGHQEILLGGGKPSAVEAAVEGSQAFDSILITLGKKKG